MLTMLSKLARLHTSLKRLAFMHWLTLLTVSICARLLQGQVEGAGPGLSYIEQYCQGMIQPYHLNSHETKTRYMSQAALALDALHYHGVMHRDTCIKPENMLLGKGGSLLLNDYDVSCISADVRARRNLQVGTPTFASPRLESVGPCQYEFRDDWLSLGLSFAWLVNIYPTSGTRQVKDALQRLRAAVMSPKHGKIQQA